MCGILGVITPRARSIDLTEAQIVRMRDLMTHRGPDGAGLLKTGNIVFAHRRLAVIDRSSSGAQPMTLKNSANGNIRAALIYNGELYNDRELRSELKDLGTTFNSRCDAETVLHAMDRWGAAALAKFRGMFALAFVDLESHKLLLARDPLGIKPLYFAKAGEQLIFASEIPPILAHPHMSTRPHLPMISAYLTTIRTVLGNETLFEGVYSIRPGQLLECDFSAENLRVTLSDWWRSAPTNNSNNSSLADSAQHLRSLIEDSVHRHLRADVPTCSLLSGGLDSSIITLCARREKADLQTYCAGARSNPQIEVTTDLLSAGDDLAFAARASRQIGTRHSEAVLHEADFCAAWRTMIDSLGVPLSTPNETAIFTVAQRLREDGCIVTLSGEGADELFAGYEGPMDAAHQFRRSAPAGGSASTFELNAHAWISADLKPAVFRPHVWTALHADQHLNWWYAQEYALAQDECGEEGLEAHLRFHRRVNLTGLLQRLDTATMLAGVEGRTPFADSKIARFAEALPMSLKYLAPDALSAHADEPVAPSPRHASAVATATPPKTAAVRTKLILREAFADRLPREIVRRPKASFPLPFRDWMGSVAPRVHDSLLMREFFNPEILTAVSSDPAQFWNLAWPMTNLSLWAKKWWG